MWKSLRTFQQEISYFRNVPFSKEKIATVDYVSCPVSPRLVPTSTRWEGLARNQCQSQAKCGSYFSGVHGRN